MLTSVIMFSPHGGYCPATAFLVGIGPWNSVRCRLRALLAPSSTTFRSRWAAITGSVAARPVLAFTCGLVVIGLCGALLAGIAGTVVGIGLLCTIARQTRRWWEARKRQRGLAGLVSAVRALAAETRAGAHPAMAARAALPDVEPDAAPILRTIAITANLGGDVPTALRERASVEPSLAKPLDRLASVWAVAQNHGAAPAGLLDAVARDLQHRLLFARELEARMAGPRTTGFVLAALPILGLLLGESTGADPLGVLTGTPVGQLLLALGGGLLCAGLLWTSRLTEGVIRA